MSKLCSICETTANAKVVNQLIEQGTSMRKISVLTGFSKAAIGRHSQRCVVRQQAQKIKSTRSNAAAGQRIFVQWPSDECAPADCRGQVTSPYGGQVPGANDTLFIVQYAPALAVDETENGLDDSMPVTDVVSDSDTDPAE